MPLSRATDTFRIDLPAAGEWVEVRRTQSVAAKNAVKALLMRSLSKPGVAEAVKSAQAGDAEAVVEAASSVDVEVWFEAQLVALDHAIVAWSFPEPVTPENIRLLDSESVDAITGALVELYPSDRTEDERKNSLTAGRERSPVAEPSLPSLAGVS